MSATTFQSTKDAGAPAADSLASRDASSDPTWDSYAVAGHLAGKAVRKGVEYVAASTYSASKSVAQTAVIMPVQQVSRQGKVATVHTLARTLPNIVRRGALREDSNSRLAVPFITCLLAALALRRALRLQPPICCTCRRRCF